MTPSTTLVSLIFAVMSLAVTGIVMLKRTDLEESCGATGFLRFDPSNVQFMPVTEVPLKPEGASVGMEVRVVGNDSGEKVGTASALFANMPGLPITIHPKC